ncbi:MAG TPA: fibronectin-binding domain-containing protein [Candidatus Latescibacteria bacterium]|nr:fibronectin-binding domain-containing protein [Candidatus Latescibacterota bacterium]
MGYDYPTLRTLVVELSEAMVGRKVERAWSFGRELYLEARDSPLLLSVEPGFPWTYLAKDVPSGALPVWEALWGARCREVRLPHRDRVLELEFARRSPLGDRVEYRLIAELMPHGDVVLVGEGGKILEALRGVRSRGILPGRSYVPPTPMGRLDPKDASLEVLRARCVAYPDMRTALSKVLSCADVNTAEAVLSLAEVDPETAPSELEDWKVVLEAAETLYREPPRGGGYLLLGEEGEPEDFLGYEPFWIPEGRRRVLPTLSGAISEVFGRRIEADRLERGKGRVRRCLRSLLKSRRRRLEAIDTDLAWARRVGEFKEKGELLAANLYRVPRGAAEVTLPSFGDLAGEVRVELDPGLSPVENMARYFTWARKAKAALEVLPGRKEETLKEISRLERWLRALEGVQSPEELEELRKRLTGEGLWEEGRESRPKRRGSEFRRYEVDGWRVLVGRDSRENDRLVREASPEDYWFHAYGVPGAHVVLKKGKEEPPAQVLEEAARIAAYHSKARTSGVVPVTCTQVKYLRRPRGARPGEVVVTRGRTLFVEPGLPENA